MNRFRIEKDNELIEVLKLLAPGTALRDGLDNILRAKTGGLVVLGDSEDIMKRVDGGFNINADYNPSYIYELAKMDGAIIVSSDLKRILKANTQLIPSSSISTFETGTRHRTAQRVAKDVGVLTVAISQRRNIITLYKGDIKYVLRESSVILARANQAIQTLEKYVSVLDRVISNLNLLEFQNLVTLFDVVTGIQRTEMVMRIVEEIERYIFELGNEGRLISMQLGELIRNIERDGIQMIRDYSNSPKNHEEVYREIQKLGSEEILSLDIIATQLGFKDTPLVDTLVSPRGYRMISKIQRIPNNVIENLVGYFNDLKAILEASYEELDAVEGIGEARAKIIRNGLRILREEFILDKQM